MQSFFLFVPALLVLFAIPVRAFGTTGTTDTTKPKLNTMGKFKDALAAFASENLKPAEQETLMGSVNSDTVRAASTGDAVQIAASMAFSPSTQVNDNFLCDTSPYDVCKEECQPFAISNKCTRNGNTDVFIREVQSCSKCKTCLRDRGDTRISGGGGGIPGGCPQVCDCYTVPMDIPQWCWWDSLTGNRCISDMFRSPVGQQTCDMKSPSGWRAERGNWDMTNCASDVNRCRETIHHRPTCWYHASEVGGGEGELCYTENRWQPLGPAWELSQDDGRMDNCITYDANPCGAVEFNPDLSCVDASKSLEEQDQVAQRVYRSIRAAELCEGKDIGPYYMDDREAVFPNDLQHSGTWKAASCWGSGVACSFGQYKDCFYDAAMITKDECQESCIKSDWDEICMIGARCAKADLTRGFCPDSMACQYDSRHADGWNGVCMFAAKADVGEVFLFLGLALAAVALMVVTIGVGVTVVAGAVTAVAGGAYVGTVIGGSIAVGASIGVGGFVGGVSTALYVAAQSGGGETQGTPDFVGDKEGSVQVEKCYSAAAEAGLSTEGVQKLKVLLG